MLAPSNFGSTQYSTCFKPVNSFAFLSKSTRSSLLYEFSNDNMGTRWKAAGKSFVSPVATRCVGESVVIRDGFSFSIFSSAL